MMMIAIAKTLIVAAAITTMSLGVMGAAQAHTKHAPFGSQGIDSPVFQGN